MTQAMSRTAGVLLMVAVAACGPTYRVRTTAAPAANIPVLHTFRMMQGPVRRDGRDFTSADGPMLPSSAANRVIREHIVRALRDRGYALDEETPDFLVAFYAAGRESLNVLQYDYGYPFSPGPGWPGWPRSIVTLCMKGSVIVDVVDPRTKELLWRGEGSVDLSKDPTGDVKRLGDAAEAVVKKLQRAISPPTPRSGVPRAFPRSAAGARHPSRRSRAAQR